MQHSVYTEFHHSLKVRNSSKVHPTLRINLLKQKKTATGDTVRSSIFSSGLHRKKTTNLCVILEDELRC